MRLLLLAPLLAIILTACPKTENALKITVETNIPPSGIGPTRFGFKLEVNDQPLTNAKVEVESNMTHPGMIPTTRTAQEIGGGRYEAQKLEFKMAGDYIVTITAKKDGKTYTSDVKFGVTP